MNYSTPRCSRTGILVLAMLVATLMIAAAIVFRGKGHAGSFVGANSWLCFIPILLAANSPRGRCCRPRWLRAKAS